MCIQKSAHILSAEVDEFSQWSQLCNSSQIRSAPGSEDLHVSRPITIWIRIVQLFQLYINGITQYCFSRILTHTHTHTHTSSVSEVVLVVKKPPLNARDIRDEGLISGLGREEGMATHFSILAWRIPWTEELGGLWSTGSQRVGHDWSTWAHTCRNGSRPQNLESINFAWQKVLCGHG